MLNLSKPNMFSIDFLILDSQADLNVYLTAAEENTNSNCCCCVEADPSGCNSAKPGLQTVPGTSNLDLNEIAGM